ncbi:MAG TPA: protein kinase [Gemmatimonadaceae bacterium]|nr:protein kinase [Gemmatimonadaceae bacterium]
MSRSGRRGAPGPRPSPPPSPDEWRRLEPLIDSVLDADPARRAALIAELSGGDAARMAELERLVAECERAFPLLDRPAADRFAGLVEGATPLVPGTLAGRYELLREAGRGGMAIVYLARDLKHGRDVAVKVVRPELAAAMGRVRFLREIEIAARLRHPHIVPLYDSGEVPAGAEGGGEGSSLLYYVMPYEAGRSLRDRLEDGGALSVEDAVRVMLDVCEALAHAHQHGVVHRDIKPDNVLLSGRHALVTDFGVARAITEATTETAYGAAGSTALGTPAYMAPEQAAGDARVDNRADIYAVGVLGYELLMGRPPFSADEPRPRTASDVADAMSELARQRADVPPALADAIAKCLATRPDDRWRSAEELLERLASIAAATGAAPAGAERRGARRVALLTAAGAAALALLALLFTRVGERPAPLKLGRASQLTSERGLEVQPAISPGGRNVAYAVGSSLHTRIAVKAMDGGRARWLTGGDTASEWLPRWSPDGARILFLSRGGVFSAPALGGAAREEVAGRPGAIVRSATWSPDGREIAYVRGDSLLARAVGSGETRLIATGADLHSCNWSPRGDRLACVSGNSFHVTVGAVRGVGPMFGNLAPSRIVLVPAAGGPMVSVTDSAALHQSPVWSRDGRTLYYVSNRHGPRDVYALDVRARTPAASEPVRVTTGAGAQSFDLSADGARLVYAAYASSANVWSLPIGDGASASPASATQVTFGNQTVEGVRVSSDGRWLVYDSNLSGSSDVYRVPVGGGDAERLTSGASDEFRGALSPDGRELVYHSFQTGSRNIFLLPLGGGPVRQLTRSPHQLAMANWSPDGTALALFSMATGEVLVMRRDRRGRWGAPRFTGGRGWRAEWSPDGRTIAFVSPTDGRIGIVPADSGAPRYPYVPGDGDPLAELALFAPSGRELYFKSHDAYGRASFWSVPAAGGRPRLLARFDDPAWSSNRFDFASDGERFYFTVEDRQSDVWVAEIAPH